MGWLTRWRTMPPQHCYTISAAFGLVSLVLLTSSAVDAGNWLKCDLAEGSVVWQDCTRGMP